MSYQYDPENIFAKILRGEIPNQTVMETDHTLAFKDIEPQAPHHILVIPKGAYVNYDHFANHASDTEIVDFTRTIGKIIEQNCLETAKTGEGYRLISNAGKHGVQDVPHLHVHILGGRVLGSMLQPTI